jgi:N-acetylmuramoyl-L-alanine amidase
MPGRIALLTGLLALLLSCPAQAGSPTAINSVRVWPAQDYTRLTLESTKPVTFNMFTLSNPERLVIDLTDVDLHGALEGISGKIGSDDPYIKSLRVAQNKPGVVRLVLDLKTAVKPQLFSLPPVAQYGHRLVLDVYPANPADPLMELAISSEKHLASPPASAIAASAPAEMQAAPVSAPQPAAPVAAPQAATKQAVANREVQPASAPAEKPPRTAAVKSDGKPAPRMLIIVIDAGHGGEDPGAHGRRGTLEKNVTLAIARKLKALIDASGNMRAILTRDGDYFIELGQRVVKARNVHADLFISIHADSFVKSKASGSSVYALSDHGATSAAAKWLAKHENEADLIGGVNIAVKDPNLAKTLLDLSQTAQISDSLKLGSNILKELGGINTLHHSRVEQAGFAVLKAPDIPSILVETAFISNPKEELRLKDEAYQEKLARAILGGIRRYFAQNPALARQRVADAQ